MKDKNKYINIDTTFSEPGPERRLRVEDMELEELGELEEMEDPPPPYSSLELASARPPPEYDLWPASGD